MVGPRNRSPAGPHVCASAARRVSARCPSIISPPQAHSSGKECLMSVIKPRTRGKRLVRHRTRLDQQNNETLYAYAQFLGESPEYVLNQVIDTVLAKDKDFVRWRAAHPESHVPRPVTTRMGVPRRTDRDR